MLLSLLGPVAEKTVRAIAHKKEIKSLTALEMYDLGGQKRTSAV